MKKPVNSHWSGSDHSSVFCLFVFNKWSFIACTVGSFPSIIFLDYIANLPYDFMMGRIAFLTNRKADAFFVISIYALVPEKKIKPFGQNWQFKNRTTTTPESTYVASTICRWNEMYYPL